MEKLKERREVKFLEEKVRKKGENPLRRGETIDKEWNKKEISRQKEIQMKERD